MISPHEDARSVILLCRDPARRAILEPLIRSAEVHTWPVEAVLSATRHPTKAVVINLADVPDSPEAFLAALQRGRPDLPVYTIVTASEEPLGRRLLRQGAADYFVLPGDVARLPHVLEPPPPPPPEPEVAAPEDSAVAAAPDESSMAGAAASASPPPEAPVAARSPEFLGAQALTEMAMRDPTSLFTDGAGVILRAVGAGAGCAFLWKNETQRLELVATVGEPLESDRTASMDAWLQANEAIMAPAALSTGDPASALSSTDAPPSEVPGVGPLCVAIREPDAPLGVVCLREKADGTPISPGDVEALQGLSRMLGRLCLAARHREHFAMLALRDAETGLLRDRAFRTYLARLVSRARARWGEVGLILLEPTESADSGDRLVQLGLALRAALPRGAHGGRLRRDRFAVVLVNPLEELRDKPPTDNHYEAMAQQLEGVGESARVGLRLRSAVAVFPRDASTVEALQATAEARLATP